VCMCVFVYLCVCVCLRVCVCVDFVMCGYFANMYTCIYCVLHCVYCVLYCFVYYICSSFFPSVRTAVTYGLLNLI